MVAPAHAGTRERGNVWQYHGNSLPGLLALFVLYNASIWMFIYTLHSPVVWTWGLGTLMPAALLSVRLPAASVAFGAPHPPTCLPAALGAVIAPLRPASPNALCTSWPLLAAVAACLAAAALMTALTESGSPALTLHLTHGMQLRNGSQVCERLLQVEGGEETLGELQHVLGLAQ